MVRKNLVSSGEGRTRIISPGLPTNENGLYLLAFYAEVSDSTFDTPVLRYFVLDKSGIQALPNISKIDVVAPGINSPLAKETSFIWQKIEGASAYQVELFNKGDDIAISGKLVPASFVKLSLSSFSLEQLMPGYEYHWKVRAFNYQGQVIAESEPRLILMSQ
ncbi:MAG: hypothetical protein JKY89_05655 [Immundisolibacteraceae bacterium]|nr:hypothetical protein [Immundisolibacteraceae bacterium]